MNSTQDLQFRPITTFEAELLARLLQVDDPLYAMLREQLSELRWAATLDSWGSIALAASTPPVHAKVRGSLPYLGVARDVDGVPIQFAVFVDKADRLSAVEVTRLDGEPLRSRVATGSISLQLDRPGVDI